MFNLSRLDLNHLPTFEMAYDERNLSRPNTRSSTRATLRRAFVAISAYGIAYSAGINYAKAACPPEVQQALLGRPVKP